MLLAACGGGNNNAGQKKTSDAGATASSGSNEAAAPVAAATDSLKIYNWSDYVDPETVKEFEVANKIKATYDFYDSNEALEAKVLTGKSGYDLVVPSNTFVGRQIKAGAYFKIDKNQIPNYNNIVS